MYIVIKNNINNIDNKEEVINVIYGDEIDTTNWITEYITREIKINLDKCDKDKKDIKDVSIKVSEGVNNQYNVIKTYKSKIRGYVYNSYQRQSIELFNIKYLPFTYKLENSSNILKTDINSEINNRILKTLDRDSLYQLYRLSEKVIRDSDIISYNKYNKITTDLLRTFRKEHFSSVVKKLNRFRIADKKKD